MIKTQTTILIMNIKASLTAIIGIVLAFLTPVIPLMLTVGAAIAIDTVCGIIKAKKLKDSITSRKMSKLISKLVLYQAAIVLFFCIEKFVLSDIIGIITQINLILTKLVATTLLFIEGTSINENYQAITGVSIWKKFKDMLARAKEVKEDIGNIVDKKDESNT